MQLPAVRANWTLPGAALHCPARFDHLKQMLLPEEPWMSVTTVADLEAETPTSWRKTWKPTSVEVVWLLWVSEH